MLFVTAFCKAKDMSLRLVSLSSGSKGNATLILSNTTAILVDCGISMRRLTQELRDFGLTPARLDGVVITHEHYDHICGIDKLSKVCDVYAHPLTIRAIENRCGEIERKVVIDNYELGFEIGDIKVVPFRIPHDAQYPLGYTFILGDARCSVATDIGEPTIGVLRNIKDSQAILLESNHDLIMLKEGVYPPYLKSRILSNRGHLSNDQTARIVARICKEGCCQKIMLGHLSEHNNTQKLAYDTIASVLEEQDSEIELYVASQCARSEVLEI